METVDEVFQNLVRDLQSVTLTADSPKAPDRAMTFSARRRTALRLVQVAIETHESTQSTLSSLSGADLAKQWRRSRDLIVKALNWVPPLRARRLWYETQTFSEVVEHCELAHIAYLTVTRGSEQAVDAIREFAQSAELVAALEATEIAMMDEDSEFDSLAWELSYGTRLYIHPVDVPRVPADARASEFFKAKSALQRNRKEALDLSGLIEWTPNGDIWHPLPPEFNDYAKAELGLLGKARAASPQRRAGRPRKISDAQLIELEKKFPRLGDRELAKQCKPQVSRSTILRTRGRRPRFRRAR